MMKILSADMASIPNSAIKKLVKKHFGANITDEGAAELAKILETEAKEISEYAVNNAKRDKRGKVTKDDILSYIIGSSDDGHS